MKLQINTAKPFYFNQKNKLIRMGNFPDTGKEIVYEDEFLIKIFKLLETPIEEEDLIKKIKEFLESTEEEIREVLNYLLEENFIINEKEISEIQKDEIYNRELLYFFMTSDKNMISVFENNRNKNILILGLGGIGSIAINILARAGFTNFTVVDFDKVEKSNLMRQMVYDLEDIGKDKSKVIKEKIKKINSNIKIKTLSKKIEEENDIKKEIELADFVLCTIDKPLRIIRRLINDICLKYNKPVLFCGFTEHYGMIGPFVMPHKTACLRCIEAKNANNDEPIENVKLTPSYGPLCNLIASITTDEIINYFIKYKNDNLEGKTLMINMLNYKTEIITWDKSNNKERCEHK